LESIAETVVGGDVKRDWFKRDITEDDGAGEGEGEGEGGDGGGGIDDVGRRRDEWELI